MAARFTAATSPPRHEGGPSAQEAEAKSAGAQVVTPTPYTVTPPDEQAIPGSDADSRVTPEPRNGRTPRVPPVWSGSVVAERAGTQLRAPLTNRRDNPRGPVRKRLLSPSHATGRHLSPAEQKLVARAMAEAFPTHLTEEVRASRRHTSIDPPVHEITEVQGAERLQTHAACGAPLGELTAEAVLPRYYGDEVAANAAHKTIQWDL
jgi:hypothetical protein